VSGRRALHLALAVALLAALPVARALRLRSLDHQLSTATYEDVYYLPRRDMLPVLSLGHREALADLIWMKGLLYFSDELVHEGDAEHAIHYTEAMLALDPHFRQAYLWVGVSALYHHGEPDLEVMERVIEIQERGVRLFPDDGELAWEVGATLSYEMAPLLASDPERYEEVKARGTEYLVRAARLGAGPPWLALNNASQLERLGRTEQAVRHLEEMYAAVDDPDTRHEIVERIARLRDAAFAEAFQETVDEMEARREREFPYVPPTFYLLLGPRIPELGPGPAADPPPPAAPGDAGGDAAP
jgi:hypothetical protein